MLQEQVKFSTTEKLLSTYYSCIVYNGESLLYGLEEHISKLILIKLSDFLMIKHQQLEKGIIEDGVYNLSKRQLAGLQYLAGYVVHQLYKKIKNSRNWQSNESQCSIAICEAMKRNTKIIKIIKNLSLL